MNSRKTNNTILVPTDFSDIARCAVNHAGRVAKAYGNEITLIFILEESFLGGLFAKNQSEIMKDAITTKLEVRAKEISEEFGVKVNTRVDSGKVYKTISDIANNEGYDSIIMGSHGASGLEQIIGSNASRTIQYAEVPVVVVKNSNLGANGYKKIVMPFDLTIESKQKLSWGVNIAQKFDSEIHIVFSDSDDEYLDRKMKNNIALVKNTLESKGVRYKLHEFKDGVFDNFANEVHNYAKIVEADLILAMTHTEKGIGEMIIGTLTQQLVNKAENIAVMCIHPAETGFNYDY
jgi:nucleotide-binding universal stress UspA family protein